MEDQYFELLEEVLSDFVKTTCANSNRDESHGWEHMQKVFQNAKQIMDNMDEAVITEDIRELVYVCSWLHDVNDHKYDDGTLTKQIRKFLTSIYGARPIYKQLILDIISRVSFSKEIKSQRRGWEVILGTDGLIVRNIVSDADKLEAIGKIGMERCIGFTKEKYLKDHGTDIPYDILVKMVREHADEKLLKLAHGYILTEPGKQMAEPLHQQMVDMLAEL